MERQENQVLGEAADDYLQFECCSIKINTAIYFACSLLIFSFEVNWIREIRSKPLIICISIRKSIFPTFENARARCRTKYQEWNLLCTLLYMKPKSPSIYSSRYWGNYILLFRRYSTTQKKVYTFSDVITFQRIKIFLTACFIRRRIQLYISICKH